MALVKSITLALSLTCMSIGAQAEIKIKTDRFTGLTQIETIPDRKTMDLGRPIPNFAARVGNRDGVQKKAVRVIFMSKSEDWKYLKCHSTYWLINGAPTKFGKVVHDGNVGKGFIVESIEQHMTVEQFAKIAAAKKVEVRICNDEFQFTEQDLTDARKVQSALHDSK